MSEHDPVLICEAMKEKGKEQIILHVLDQKLGADYENGIGLVKVADGSAHERMNTMRVPLLTSESWWRGNSSHANQLRHAITCFQEKIALEFDDEDGGGSVFEPKVGRIAAGDGQDRAFIVDYIARSDGSYYAMCKSILEPMVFVRVGVKEAACYLSKGKVASTPNQPSTRKRKSEVIVAPMRVDMNFFIGAISNGSISGGHEGLFDLCRSFRQAEVFIERQAEIDELKEKHRKLSLTVQSDMASNVFDVDKMVELSEIMRELNKLMQGVEEVPAVHAVIPPESYLTPGQASVGL